MCRSRVLLHRDKGVQHGTSNFAAFEDFLLWKCTFGFVISQACIVSPSGHCTGKLARETHRQEVWALKSQRGFRRANLCHGRNVRKLGRQKGLSYSMRSSLIYASPYRVSNKNSFLSCWSRGQRDEYFPLFVTVNDDDGLGWGSCCSCRSLKSARYSRNMRYVQYNP